MEGWMWVDPCPPGSLETGRRGPTEGRVQNAVAPPAKGRGVR